MFLWILLGLRFGDKMKSFVIFSFLIFSISVVRANSKYPQITDSDVLEYLFSKAARLSGIKAYNLKEAPPIYVVTKLELNSEVCPEDPNNCRNLAAVFDDLSYRILIRDDLEITSNFNPFNYSFLIHEIIHSLQYRSFGAEIFNGCDAVYKTEELAYNSQDQYLKEEGEFFRAGIALKYFYCDPEQADKDYQKSKIVWEQRLKDNIWPPNQ
jgi:hypothetical protein